VLRYQRQALAAVRRYSFPLLSAFLLGYASGVVLYPVFRAAVLFTGPLGAVKLAFLEADHSAHRAAQQMGASLEFTLFTLLNVGCGLLFACVLLLELRRTSPTVRLWRSKLYRLALALVAASFFLPTVSRWLMAPAGVLFVAAAWSLWGRRRRLLACSLFGAAFIFSAVVQYYADLSLLEYSRPS
jgi:hypothetical protein